VLGHAITDTRQLGELVGVAGDFFDGLTTFFTSAA
jgi:hypothetical protein